MNACRPCSLLPRIFQTFVDRILLCYEPMSRDLKLEDDCKA
jgi:hypothetical protein